MRDFRADLDSASIPTKQRRKSAAVGAGVVLLSAVAVALSLDDAEAIKTDPAPAIAHRSQSVESLPVTPQALTPPPAHEIALPNPQAVPQLSIKPTVEPAQSSWQSFKVKSGDTLSALFSRANLSAQEMLLVLEAGFDKSLLTQLYPGESIDIAYAADGTLEKLRYQPDRLRTLQVSRTPDGFAYKLDEKQVETRHAYASGVINSSLWQDALSAGLSENVTMQLAEIFGWDVDFALDLRGGDRFSVIYEEQYVDGDKIRDGSIVAAEFVNRGEVFRATRFVDDKEVSNYFTPEGRSMRKAFLRSPVDFRRISSKFQGARWHPVLGKKRPHRGVDYAAATGTPIRATGDGRVIHAGTKGGYGKTVILKHGQTYTTLFAHMSRYARGIRSGKYVKQGQIIGYVGKTGVATGPHLHYEFRVRGTHRNPLTVKFPDAEPLEKKYRERFNLESRPLLAQLDLLSQDLLARLELSAVTDDQTTN
jgi:murein DD-endopeptidase MepM/ murein hydrolase activator NlpD